VLTIVAAVSVTVVAVIFLAPQLLAASFFDGATDVVRATALIALFWSLDTVFLSLYRATRRMVTYAVLSVAEAYSEIILSVVLIRLGFGLTRILLAVAAVQAVFLMVFLAMSVKETGVCLPRFRRMGQYLRFGIPTILSNSAAWVVSSSSRYALGYFSGAASVGVFAAAYTIGAVALPVAAVLGVILGPTLSSFYDNGQFEDVRKYLLYSMKLVLLANVPFVVGAAVLGKEVLAILTTPELASAGWPVVPLAAFAIMLCSLHAVLAESLVVAKRTRTVAAIWLAAAGANIVGNIVLVPPLGGVGAALAGIIGFGTGLCLTYFRSRGVTRPSVEPGFLAKLGVASGVMGIVARLLQPKTLAATVFAVVLSTAVYVTGLAVMRVFSRD
jgi:O-antigen/teichoic acid export membrane protein